MKQYRFRALVTLDASTDADGGPARQYPSGTHAVMVHVLSSGPPGADRYFAAVLDREDARPLRPGDHAVVTITLNDDEAATFFVPGSRFAMWAGTDIGHGVVSRRAFVPSGPC